MNYAQKQSMREVVLSLADTGSVSATGWVRVHCPFCEEQGHRSTSKNLAINPESGWFRCWRWEACGAKGNMYGRGSAPVVSATYAPLSVADVLNIAQSAGEDPSLKLPERRAAAVHPVAAVMPGFKLIDPHTPGQATAQLMYLLRRGVSRKTILGAGLGYSTDPMWSSYVVIPIINQGQYRGFVARSLQGKAYKNSEGYSREDLFNCDALHEETDVPIAIVEGLFDALPHWPYAVACNGKPTDAQLEVIAQAKRPICMMLDADAQLQGSMAALRLRMNISLQGKDTPVYVAKLDPGTDPGELTREQFVELLFKGDNE